MKYCIVAFLLITPFLWVYAHETKTENPLSVLLHIEPDDDPVAGEPAEIFFAFSDDTQAFDVRMCTCVVTVTDQGDTLFEGLVTQTDERLYGTNVAGVTTVFPHTGWYNITLSATPRAGASFTQTTLSYDVEIKRDTKLQTQATETTEENQNTLDAFHIYGICAGCTLLIGAGFIAFRQYAKRMV